MQNVIYHVSSLNAPSPDQFYLKSMFEDERLQSLIGIQNRPGRIMTPTKHTCIKSLTVPTLASLILLALVGAGSAYAQDVEVNGPIESVNSNTITVHGISFTVISDTRIEGDKGIYMEFADFRDGHRVEIEGYHDRDAGMVASKLEWEADEVEAEGRIDRITDSDVTVNGIRFDIDRQTRMKKGLRFQDLREGDTVEIDGIRDGSGRFVGLEIERERDASNEVKVEGQIETITETSLTVNGVSFQFGSRTRLEDYRGLDDIRQGDVVDVDGFRNRDGNLVASKIERE